MKSLMCVLEAVLANSGQQCGVCTTRDVKTLRERSKHEGQSFLTITLAQFRADFDQSLGSGCVAPSAFPGFSRVRGLPRFLGGFLELVFDRSDGTLLDDPSIDAIREIRQITGLAGKLFSVCSEKRVRRAMSRFVECEQELHILEESLSQKDVDDFARAFRIVHGDALDRVSLKLAGNELVPKHGPGATADRLRGNQKFRQVEWTERLEAFFPADTYLLPNHRHWTRLETVKFLEPGQERPVKVIPVPKTMKTPRIIAVEPTCMQYAQQALMREFVSALEELSPFVGFSDQEPNRLMAQEGSRSGDLATLDLSEASDRVLNRLVLAGMSAWPDLSGSVQACRSTRADVPGHGIVSLAKFASMGSALCFPVEAMVFSTLAFMGVADALSVPLSRSLVQQWSGRVRVYGDDILVPGTTTQAVISRLNQYGAVVNRNKSFWSGSFRESCGGEFYAGEDVTSVRVRKAFPRSRQDAEELAATVSLRNQLYKAGLWGAAKCLDDMLGRIAPMPRVLETSPVLGRVSALGYQTDRICHNLHRPLVRGLVVRAVARVNPLDGVDALMKFFLHRHGSPEPLEKTSFLRSGRPDCVRTQIRWAVPY